MTYSLVHLSDPHFGVDADPHKTEAVQHLIPDLEPDLVVITGDLTDRARHGEFQAAQQWIRGLARFSSVFVIPGNHDVEWWRRPLVPFGGARKYEMFSRYFGPVIAPTLRASDVVVASVVTAHGLAWRSLTPRPKEWRVTGHLDRKEIQRASSVFADADEDQLHILVMHHNILRGEISNRMGVSRWRKVHHWLMESGADLILCGHDGLAKADVMGGIVVSASGSLSLRHQSDRPATIHRIVVEDSSIQIQLYEWVADRKRFRRTDVLAFSRPRTQHVEPVPAGIV